MWGGNISSTTQPTEDRKNRELTSTSIGNQPELYIVILQAAVRQTSKQSVMAWHNVNCTCLLTWIGNTRPVALKHYLQITDEHFEMAARGAAKSDAASARKGTATDCSPVPRTPKTLGKACFPRVFRVCKAGPLGLEPRTTEPESAVLPITPRANLTASSLREFCYWSRPTVANRLVFA